MKRFVLALAFFMAAPLALLGQQTAPEIPFESVPNLLKLPEDLYLGEASGVAVDRKSTRLNSSHLGISYAVFCLKKKKTRPCVRACSKMCPSNSRPGSRIPPPPR